MHKQNKLTRRHFIQNTAIGAAVLSTFPYINCGKIGVTKPMTRPFGRLGFDVTTLGLGGQASIQWTPDDVDPVKIILKSFQLGVNYYDTSNLYGPSQNNYGKAFKHLDLIPGQAAYDEKLRKSIFLTSKTHLRFAKGDPEVEGVANWSNGGQGLKTIDDLKRSLSQIFGDGQGNYPKGAYLDMILLHSMTRFPEIDAVFTGLKNTDPKSEVIGALAALRDYRDGTNLTGLNPKEEKLINHIGFSGHFSPPVMMELIQRDDENLFDGMLLAINANDKQMFNMQHNVMPVGRAKNMGIIAMKVFADGAMYTKEATWSREPKHVVRTVGSPELPSRPLVHYSLTTPGVHTAIIGIGEISDDSKKCQLEQNLSSAQITENALTATQRNDIEQLGLNAKEGKTNYFQTEAQPLSAPREASIIQRKMDKERVVKLTWQTAYAGNEPIEQYDILRDGQKIGTVSHIPQTTKDPFVFKDPVRDTAAHTYQITSVDATGQTATSKDLILKSI